MLELVQNQVVDQLSTEEGGWIQELELVRAVVAEQTDAQVNETCQVKVGT